MMEQRDPTVEESDEEVEEFSDVEDESVMERLAGLSEMFPDSLRHAVGSTASLSAKGAKCAYRFTRSAMWIVGTSFVVLALPVIFEAERVQAEEAARMQERQILLGPGAGGPGAGGLPGVPQMGMSQPRRRNLSNHTVMSRLRLDQDKVIKSLQDLLPTL